MHDNLFILILDSSLPNRTIENILEPQRWIFKNKPKLSCIVKKPLYLTASCEQQIRIGVLENKSQQVFLTKQEAEDHPFFLAFNFTCKEDFVLFNKEMSQLKIYVCSKLHENI